MARLPAIFPDGMTVDRKTYSWMINDLIRTHSKRLKHRKEPLFWLQNWLSRLLIYAVVPTTLLLCWARYLPRHELIGTGIQIATACFAIASAIVFYSLGKITMCKDKRKLEMWSKPFHHPARMLGQSSVTCAIGVLLCFFSYKSIKYPEKNSLGHFRSYVQWEQLDISKKPDLWTNLDKQYELVKGAQLSKYNLVGAHAKKAFLARADLNNSILHNAQLSEANLREANLNYAQLDKANLNGALLNKANLNNASLNNTQLYDTHLNGARLSGAHLQNAYLMGADLTSAQLQNAYLNDAHMAGANLKKAKMQLAHLNNADLRGADLMGAIFKGTDLRGVQMDKGTNLTNTIFSESTDLRWADLRDVKLNAAKSLEVILNHARLNYANLSGARLERVKMIDSDLGGANLNGANLRNADLRDANLSGADLRNAYLNGTDLQNADLTGANVTGAHFDDANLSGANLWKVSLTKALGLSKQQLNKTNSFPLHYSPSTPTHIEP